MNYNKSNAAFIAERTENVNVQPLLDMLLIDDSVDNIRRNLLDVYFEAVNSVLREECGCGTFADSLHTLQRLIETIDLMKEPGERHLEVKVV